MLTRTKKGGSSEAARFQGNIWIPVTLGKTKRYRTTLWLVHNLISNIVPKKMGVPLVWRLKLAHYVPKIGKSNKKRCLATI